MNENHSSSISSIIDSLAQNMNSNSESKESSMNYL